MKLSEENRALFARLDDMCAAADKGELSVSAFLSSRELYYAQCHLNALGASFISFGGYEGAERQRIYVLPEYLENVSDASELVEYGFDVAISCIEIIPSGYRALSHRDYMGSILGLGVERDVVGDILVREDGSAIVLCASLMRDFFVENLVKVANDKVKSGEMDLRELKIPERRFAEINDTVASARLDCVIGALCSMSREKAKTAVETGLVEVNFECDERPDRTVAAPCIISVRGYGRYEVLSVGDKTKKGRYRLSARKYL